MKEKKTPALGDALTEREAQVWLLLCGDCSTKEIYESLGIDRGTFSQHQHALQIKLGCRTRTGLVVKCIDNEGGAA